MVDMDDAQYHVLRQEMVGHIGLHTQAVRDEIGRDALDARVMAAMAEVPRHAFVPAELREFAYLDTPLPIGFGKTVSQPFIVALMTDLLELDREDRVLEIGTGLGYHTAVLASLVDMVFSVEIIEGLARDAEERLATTGYSNAVLRLGDGSRGWTEHAPFDKMIVAAAPELIPPLLLSQLKPNGRMVVPAGIEDAQQLMLVKKNHQGRIDTEEILPVRFAPMEVIH